MKKFDSISRLKRGFHNWEGDDMIHISEKIDGANASIHIKFDSDGNISESSLQSRRQVLSESNTLNGFYNYAMDELIPRLEKGLANSSYYFNLVNDIIVFGEWLTPHAVKYKEDCYRVFYPFAAFNVLTDKYMSDEDVKFFTNMLQLTPPKMFYQGLFKDVTLSQMMEFVGKSTLALDSDGGEGVVVWNMDCDDNDFCRIKLISDKFSEMQSIPTQKVHDATETELWIGKFITEQRVTKALHLLHDEGKLPEIDFKNFLGIAKPVYNYVYDDILKEESDSMPELFDEAMARGRLGKLAPRFIRMFIENFGS